MKKGEIILILLIGVIFSGCQKKKEDAPPPNYPHVEGTWNGNGTDDAIGYFNLAADITQSNDQAAGQFTMAGTVATIKGDINIVFGPQGGNNVRTLTLTRNTWTVNDPANVGRVCAATMTLTPNTASITGSFTSFHYTVTDCQGGVWQGGANMTKMTRGN